MRKIAFLQIFCLVLLILFGGINRSFDKINSEKTASLSSKSQKEIKCISKVISLIESKDSEKAWPSLTMNDSPLVFTFDSGRIYAIYLDYLNLAWEKVGINNQEVLLSEKDHWDVLNVKLHPCFDLDGQEAFVFHLNRKSDSLPTFIHERFHLYQMEFFSNTHPFPQNYEDHLNAENLALIVIEDEILISFLKNEDKLDRNNLIRDFLAINQERRQLMSHNSFLWENQQQRLEGLADYVSAKMFDGEKQVSKAFDSGEKEEDFADYAIKWRHYFVGATVAFMLDFLELDWKKKVEEGQFLIEVLQSSIESDENRIESIKERYSYTEILEKARRDVQGFQNHLKDLQASYSKMEGFPLRIGSPIGMSISGGGNSDRLYYLADGTRLSLKDNSNSLTTDSNWQFATHQIPFLIQKMGFRECKVQANQTILLNNKEIEIAELLKGPADYPFHSLFWENEHFTLSSEQHFGVLISTGRGLTIAYF